MWPFDRRKRQIRRAFSRYLSPDFLDDVVNDPAKAASAASPKSVEMHFILLQNRDGTLTDMQNALTRTTEIAIAANGFVEKNLSSIVLITFGVPHFDAAAAVNQARVVASLISVLGQRVRLVHGQATALVGLWGGGLRVFYGSLIPDFGRCLQRLLGLAFGTAERLGGHDT